MLFKILHGDGSRISTDITPFHEGYCYVTHDGFMYIDMNVGTIEAPNNQRVKLNAQEAERLTGYSIATILNYSNIEIATSAAVLDALSAKADKTHNHDGRYYTESEIDSLLDGLATEDYVNSAITTNYDESIIGLSVDGRVVTYIKGDGSTHSFTTQDTDTTYSLATDSVTGLTKLYATTGSAEDGTMTQKAIKTELDKKVGVTVDNVQGTLIFTI